MLFCFYVQGSRRFVLTKGGDLVSLYQNTEDPNPLLQTCTAWVVVTNKGQSALPNANHYQGQLQTLQRETVLSGKRISTHFSVPCEL
jgi:hypothetical protein